MPDPSILIAFGSFGLRVLRGFLDNASTRGALVWDSKDVVGALNERKLESLSLFWAPDALGSRDIQAGSHAGEDNAYELMDDVFNQIQVLEGSFQQVRALLEKGVEAEKKRLIDARHYDAFGVPSLDVFIIAQPTSQAMVGHIRNLTEPAMAKLSEDPTFRTAQFNSRLNFTHVFDFDNYWQPPMAPVREALRRMVDENGRAPARPAFGRMYLFDGTTGTGHRPEGRRQQEIILFLEFLLLEGLRSQPDAKDLFERPGPQVSPIACVGIRAAERSSGLLRRLAAATFAYDMLAYMASSPGGASHRQPLFEDLLAPFQPSRLPELIGEGEIRKLTATEIARTEQAMLALPPLAADWTENLREVATMRTETAIVTLSQSSGVQNSSHLSSRLKDFQAGIETAITEALQDSDSSMTIGSMINELQRLEDHYATLAVAARDAAADTLGSEKAFQQAGQMQREYFLYERRQVRTAELRIRWWPRAAIIFAVAFFPILVKGLENSPINGLWPAWVISALCALLLGLLFWDFGRRVFSPALNKSAMRGLDFYVDPERGRLSERVRQAARSADVAGKLESHAESLIQGLKQYALGAVADELRRAGKLLCERKEEILWLREQVGEFSRSNHLEDSGQGPGPAEVCVSLDRVHDLHKMEMASKEDNFRDQIRIHHLLKRWPEKFCPTFLHPLPFLDELSTSFTDNYEGSESDSNAKAKQVVDFLKQKARVSICFNWLAADGLPSVQKGNLLPEAWKGLAGVTQSLNSDTDFNDRKFETSNSERLYLFQWMLGVPAELMVTASQKSDGGRK